MDSLLSISWYTLALLYWQICASFFSHIVLVLGLSISSAVPYSTLLHVLWCDEVISLHIFITFQIHNQIIVNTPAWLHGETAHELMYRARGWRLWIGVISHTNWLDHHDKNDSADLLTAFSNLLNFSLLSIISLRSIISLPSDYLL